MTDSKTNMDVYLLVYLSSCFTLIPCFCKAFSIGPLLPLYIYV